MQKLVIKLKELRPKLIMGFGSTFTGKKKGINKLSDVDILIVSDLFKNISQFHRKTMINNILGTLYDTVNLTVEEYRYMLKNRNERFCPLSKGAILYQNGKNNF